MSEQYTGVNLSGLEFGGGIGGTNGTDYISNGQAQYDYWAGAGANTIRLPFTWERLQPQANGALDAGYLQLLHDAVDRAQANGQTLILDMHNYGAYFGQGMVGNDPALKAAYVDVWTRLANEFKTDANVWFGLMNEPHDIPADTWMGFAQAATDAIRGTGAGNRLLVPTVDWSGAHRFNDPNYADEKAVYESFVDSGTNFAFEVHQYLDQDNSGSSGDAVDGKGATVMQGLADWARAHGYDIFVGEFGVAADGANADEYGQFLEYMTANSDVFLGWTAWGAGEWWPDTYHYYLGNQDETGTDILDDFFKLPRVTVPATSGNDVLDGTWGDDVIRGGPGNDLLRGGAGSDIYVYARGHGTDYLDDEAGFTDNYDVLRFTDMKLEDVVFTKNGVHLEISIMAAVDSITVDEQFYSPVDWWGIEIIQFADGTTMDRNQILAAVTNPQVTVQGTSGNDALAGNWGNDVIRGGLGNDTLLGSAGNDTYIYSSGDGSDDLDDEAGFIGNYDVLLFTDINRGDVTFARNGVHLEITVTATGHVITVDEQFYSDVDWWGIEIIQFADDPSMNRAQILAAVTAPQAAAQGASGDDGRGAISGSGLHYWHGFDQDTVL